MCGIFGYWTTDKEQALNFQACWPQVREQLKHRGPDSNGFWEEDQSTVGLGHTRLAILDLSTTGHQPMLSTNGTACISYNGEVYNHVELRDELMKAGARFTGTSDTEVILHLYEKHGLCFVEKLRGMFAIAIWDRTKKRMILARDRLGKKPLYYWANNHGVCFASEVKAFREVLKPHHLEIDYSAIDNYLTFGATVGPGTIYKCVQKVLPASMVVFSSPSSKTTKSYWSIPLEEDTSIPPSTLASETETHITKAIELRLRSDVPVGVFLSGGLDSSLIALIASKLSDRQLESFSVNFDDSQYNEAHLAKIVAKTVGTNHHQITLRPDIELVLPQIINSFDEPFADPSAVPTFLVSEFAGRHVKVVLSGDGGDELFCGYRRHLAGFFLQIVTSNFGASLPSSLAKSFLNLLPTPRKHRSKIDFFYRFLTMLVCNDLDRPTQFCFNGFDYHEKQALYKDHSLINSAQPLSATLNRIPSFLELEELGRMVAVDLLISLPEVLLVKMDTASMAHGLEVRSPFLDQDLVSWAMTVPNKHKLKGFQTKAIIRELASKHLPTKVAKAPKRGFEPPTLTWLTGELKEMLYDLLLSRQGVIDDLFSRKQEEQLLAGPEKNNISPGRWAQLTWTLLVLALWEP